jgi:hypothetical protein
LPDDLPTLKSFSMTRVSEDLKNKDLIFKESLLLLKKKLVSHMFEVGQGQEEGDLIAQGCEIMHFENKG